MSRQNEAVAAGRGSVPYWGEHCDADIPASLPSATLGGAFPYGGARLPRLLVDSGLQSAFTACAKDSREFLAISSPRVWAEPADLAMATKPYEEAVHGGIRSICTLFVRLTPYDGKPVVHLDHAPGSQPSRHIGCASC